MGFEGDFRKSLYAQMASRWRIGSFKRIQRVRARDRDDDTRVKFVNMAIDHGNCLAYRIASLVLWILGIPGNMPVSHGHSRAGGLVYDLAILQGRLRSSDGLRHGRESGYGKAVQ